LVPLWAAFRFSLAYNGTGFSAKAYSGLAGQQGFGAAIWLSVQLSVVTTFFELAVMVPTTVYIHLRRPGLRRVMDFVTSLPLVVPPVVLVLGVLTVAPSRLKATPFLLALEYVVLAVPFSYRALDAGVRSIDVKSLPFAGRRVGYDDEVRASAQHAGGGSFGHGADRGSGPGRVHHGQPRPVPNFPHLDRPVRSVQFARISGGFAHGALFDVGCADRHLDGRPVPQATRR
jgi:hypothetical protein